VLAWHQHGNLMHTHFPEPMRLILEALAAAGRPAPAARRRRPRLGGIRGRGGAAALGFADCNDPGLFVSEAEGQLEVAVPLTTTCRPGSTRP
jgi:hypothetical protein